MITFEKYYKSYREATVGGRQLDYVNAGMLIVIGGYLLFRYTYLRDAVWLPEWLMMLMGATVLALGLFGLFFAIPRKYRFLEYRTSGDKRNKHEVVAAISKELGLKTNIKGSNFYELVYERGGRKNNLLVYIFFNRDGYRYQSIEDGKSRPISWVLNIGLVNKFNAKLREALAKAGGGA